MSEGGDVTILVCLNVVVVVTQRYHLVRRVLPELLQRVEVVGDVPGDEVDPELVHEVVEPLAGLHLEVPDHKGRQRHVSVSGCAGVPRPTVPAAAWSPVVPRPGHGSAQFDGHPTLTFRSAGLVTAAPSTLYLGIEVLPSLHGMMASCPAQLQLRIQA